MELTVVLMGRVLGARNTRHFVLRKKGVHLNGVGLKRWLEIDLGPTYRDPLNMTIQFYQTSCAIVITADNAGLTDKVVQDFKRVVEVNFRNLD